MQGYEKCPRCPAVFIAREALVTGGVRLLLGVFAIGPSSSVRCPGCGHEFRARTLKHFGFLPHAVILWGTLIAAAAGVLFFTIASSW
jgi:hypothetical protein